MEYQGPTGLLKDDEPAFPVDAKYGLNTEYSVGMSLRDYFAAAALQGWIASLPPDTVVAGKEDRLAKHAYELADAMLKARK